jgi:hypothetical protein
MQEPMFNTDCPTPAVVGRNVSIDGPCFPRWTKASSRSNHPPYSHSLTSFLPDTMK